MKQVIVLGGFLVSIDREDWELLYRRQLKIVRLGEDKVPYVMVGGYKKGWRKWGVRVRACMLHRFLMRASARTLVDHIDRNSLNNQRSNLRLCSRQGNGANVGLSSANTSGYKGVSWNKNAKKWSGHIKVNYRKIHLGYFSTKEKAALAYNEAARKAFKTFACLNDLPLAKA